MIRFTKRIMQGTLVGDKCDWCGKDAAKAAEQHEGPHAAWCVHFREDQRGGRTPKHTVDLDEMLAWIADGYVTYASSSSEPKCLEVRIAGGYRVRRGDKTVYEGTDGKSAVDAYNAQP